MSDYVPSPHVRPRPDYMPSLQEVRLDQPLSQSFSSAAEVQLREYWRVVFKYRTIIAGIIVACLLLAVIYAFTATPRYSAESKIRISTYEPVLTATKIEDLLQQKSKEASYLETQIEEIRSFSLADRALEDQTIREALAQRSSDGVFSRLFGARRSAEEQLQELNTLATYKAPINIIKKYLETIEVRPIRRTSLVVIRATTTNPALSALISNKHALSYIDWTRSNRIEQQARGLEFLRGQAEELREKVAGLEREMADYAEANSIVALNKDENITAQKMSQLNRLLTEATAKRIETEHLWKEAENSLGDSAAGFDDPGIQQSRSELAKLEGEYQQLSAKFTSSYPRMQQLRSQIEALRASIGGQRRQVVSGLRAKAIAAAEEEKNLKEELEQQKSRTFELSKKEVQYNVLNRELTTSRDLLQNVLKQIKETSLAVESNASNVSVVDFASVPRKASYPKKAYVIVIGLLVGIGAGLTFAFLINYLDNTIRTPEQLMDHLGLPNLGVVPSFVFEGLPETSGGGAASGAQQETMPPRGLQSKELVAMDEAAGNLPIVYLHAPKSLASEAYRTIRTGILLSRAGQPPRTMLVSSAQSSEGKTTSSVNLAASLASAGGRVVLVDADLRRPSVTKHFGLDSGLPGLVEVITGQRQVSEVYIRDIIRRVTVIPAGRIPPNPAELLGSLEMASLIDQLSREFDYVIIDSPPVLPVTDSVILSRYVDGVVLVIKGASTPRRVVTDARNRLRAVGANILGAILNDVDITNGDYYYYNRYYHSYTQDPGSAGREGRAGSTRMAS